MSRAILKDYTIKTLKGAMQSYNKFFSQMFLPYKGVDNNNINEKY